MHILYHFILYFKILILFNSGAVERMESSSRSKFGFELVLL